MCFQKGFQNFFFLEKQFYLKNFFLGFFYFFLFGKIKWKGEGTQRKKHKFFRQLSQFSNEKNLLFCFTKFQLKRKKAKIFMSVQKQKSTKIGDFLIQLNLRVIWFSISFCGSLFFCGASCFAFFWMIVMQKWFYAFSHRNFFCIESDG